MALGYKDIKNSIHQEILSGKLEPGSRLPTGKELCEIHSVSNLTVDRALRELVKEGLINRHRQKGTFVADMLDRSHGAIALLIPTLSAMTTFAQFAEGVQKSLQQRNFQLILEHTQMDMNLTIKAVHKVVRDGVKGVIYVPAASTAAFEQNAEALNYLRKNNISVVVAGHCDLPGLEWVSGVSSDHYNGAKSLINHLVKCGHRNIALFGGLMNRDQHYIFNGYRDAMAENGITVPDRWVCTFDPQISISNKVKQFIQAAGEVTAIFGINDTIAAEAIRGLDELGMKIPQDMAIVGFSDHPLCKYLSVGLTTVHVQHQVEGELLAGMLLDIINGNIKGPSRIELPCPLVIRQSCGVGLHSPSTETKTSIKKTNKRGSGKTNALIGLTESKRVSLVTVKA